MPNLAQIRQFLPYFIIASFSIIVFLQPIYSPDYWTHLAFGREFLDSLSVNIDEPFLRYGQGEPIDNTEWPFQVLLYLAHSIVGDVGISILVAIAGAAAFIPVIWLCANDTDKYQRYAFVALLMASIFVARFRIEPRPEVIAYVLFSANLALTAQWVRTCNWRPIAAVAVLFLAWVPLHVTWSVGIIFWAVFLISQTDTKFWSRLSEESQMRWCIWLIGMILLFGTVDAARFAWEVLIGLQDSGRLAGISEMRPVWEFPSVAWQFYSVAAVAGLLTAFSRERRIVRLMLWAMALVFGSIVVRNVAFALIAMMFGVAAGFKRAELPHASMAKPHLPLAITISAILFLFTLSLAERDYARFAGLRKVLFPIEAARLVKTNNLATPIFNNFDSGGYLNWAWQGTIKTFIDGRALGGDALLKDHYDVIEAKRPDLLFEKHNIRTVVTQAAYHNSGRIFPIVTWLLRDPGWSLVGAADGLVFTRDPVPAEVTEQPSSLAWSYVVSYIEELEQINDDMPHAGFSKGIAYFYLGDYEQARADFRDASEAYPQLLKYYLPYIQALQRQFE